MAELHLYDFDGTLFKSPSEPAVWDGEWWNDVRSLIPPCVPQKPGADWWVGSTVSSAKQSIANSDVYAMMVTGRNDRSGLRFRVPELLKQAGLDFDEVHLTPIASTITHKKKVLMQTLRKYPQIDTLKVWDDRPTHLRDFEKVAESMGIDPDKIELNLVRARAKDPLCDSYEVVDSGLRTLPEQLDKCRYVGIFLDASSKAKLAFNFPFAHDKIKNDHVTLCLGSFAGVEDMVGKRVRMKVVGYAEDDKGQAVVVSVPPGLMQDDRTPHVTLSVKTGVPAKYSNQLLSRGWDRVDGPSISGIVDINPRALRRTAHASRVASLYKLGK